MRQILDQAFNRGNLTFVDELVSVEISTHFSVWGLPANRLGLKHMIANLRFAFPDLHCTIDDEIGEANRIAALWTMRGTHTGAYFGILPTGRPVKVQAVIFARTEKDWIVEQWILIDQIGILQQIGVVPPPRANI